MVSDSTVHVVRGIIVHGQHILMVQHRHHNPRNIGTWGLPGGWLENSETPEDGLKRELYEELRLQGDVVSPKIGKWERQTDKYHQQHHVFVFKAKQKIIKLDPKELWRARWYLTNEIKHLRTTLGWEKDAILIATEKGMMKE